MYFSLQAAVHIHRMTNGVITDEAWEKLMKDTSRSSNTNMTDFLTNNNTAEIELDFSADALDFDPWNLDVPTSFGGITRTLSPPAFCTMFNFNAALILFPQRNSQRKIKSLRRS